MSNDKVSIGERGAMRAKALKLATQEDLRKAMKEIENDIEENEGVYPWQDGRVTADELIRRAGKSKAILQKPAHKVFNCDEVQPFLKRCADRACGKRSDVRKAVNELVHAKQGKLTAYENKYALAEVEYDNAKREIMDEKSKNKKLEADLADCTRELADALLTISVLEARLNGTNVVSMPPSRSKNMANPRHDGDST